MNLETNNVVLNDVSSNASDHRDRLFSGLPPVAPKKVRKKKAGNETANVVLNDALPTDPTHRDQLFSDLPPLPSVDKKKQLKQKKSKWQNSHLDMVAYLERISDERKVWEDTLYKKSNEGLYRILSICLDIFGQMKGRGLQELYQRNKLNEALKARKLTFTSSTHLTTKIIRLVFGSDRKRSYTYSRVILSAHEHGIDSMRLPRWIADNGGVEEIRRKSTNALSQSQINEQYKDIAETRLAQADNLVASFKPPKGLATTGEGNLRYTVAIVRDNGDGTSSLVYGINNETVVKAALHYAGKALKEVAKVADISTKARQVKSKRSEILNKAA